MTDEELVVAMARGNQAAFEALVHRYHAPLLGYLERMLRDRRKAEDVVQETFLKLIKQLKTKKTPEKIKPWLYQVAPQINAEIIGKARGLGQKSKFSTSFQIKLTENHQ
ncbi:RNA polymerase sigma factor [Guptibacillus hwajinpoensis]|uniref:RNA polymerase sigma factor n=1 Tax=Guptibacillus hwajinpoensis TaxID=208199 RepID=UPI00273E9F2E|nr:sigma factor [Pseudalkalibacillus hwajinpoensis]WLR61129.1 sigma factor [Pseudalkalibacillus hwajinpoensis]